MIKDIPKFHFKEGLPQEFEILNIAELYENFYEDLTTPHRAEFYQIIWIQKGNPIHMVDFNAIQTEPNSVVFVNKSSVQQFDKNVAFDGKIILFTDNFFCKNEADTKFLKSTILFNDLLGIPYISIPNIDSQFNSIIKLIETELVISKDQYQSELLISYLHNLLLLSERERRKQDFIELKKDTNLDYVMLFKELLENQFYHEKLVNNYAAQMHITKKKLNIATKKIIGKSPKQIIDARTILEAKRLLAHSTETIKEISFALGFDEPTNFVKFFKKHQNTTPLEFRNSLL